MRILIVEDDPFVGRQLARQIKQTYPDGELTLIGPVDNYRDALEILQREIPEIVVLDIELGEDRDAGIRLAQYINYTRPAYLIFITGLERERGYHIAKMNAPHDFIQKPFEPSFFGERLEIAYNRALKMNVEQRFVSVHHSHTLFVKTGYGEFTGIHLDELSYLEADDYLIKAFVTNQKVCLFFNSPGLKNFHAENEYLLKDFYQLSRKHLINLKLVGGIKDNHVLMPLFSMSSQERQYVYLPIPKNGDSKKMLMMRLGLKF